MKRNILSILFLLFITLLSAQVGINTKFPLGAFHIDPDNNTTSINVGVNDDFIIDTNGNVGIGTVIPSNKLSIVPNGSPTDTGLHLPNGASMGKVLTSDGSGNATWTSSAIQFQTMVEGGIGKPVTFTNAHNQDGVQPLTFFNVKIDNARTTFGPNYGWDTNKHHYVAPVTGVYRIAFSIYYISTVKTHNHRGYIYKKNGPNPGILFSVGSVSITDTGNDLCGYNMGLVELTQGDEIDLRVCTMDYGNVIVYDGIGHTFLIIESL